MFGDVLHDAVRHEVPDRLSGLDAAMADAVSLKFLAAPLTKEQQDDLFKYYARGAK